MTSPNVNNTDPLHNLQAVAAISANDMWAVGYHGWWDEFDGGWVQTLIEHWDGSAWSIIPSPNSRDGANNRLLGIAAISTTDIWAAGFWGYGSFNLYHTLLMHWDGAQWSIVPSPDAGTGSSYLLGIEAVSASDIWAVGYFGTSGSSQPMIEHWDGSTWSVVPSPNGSYAHNRLSGVRIISPSDIWAVGYSYNSYPDYRTFTMHWDGTQWVVVPSPNAGSISNRLTSVAALSADDVWAVGYTGNAGYSGSTTLVEHWDGSQWSIVPSPNAGSVNFLNGVVALSRNDVWAVGYFYSNPLGYKTFSMYWNGTQWSLVPGANVGEIYGNYLYGVAAISPNEIWAVGFYQDEVRGRTLAERYRVPCAVPTTTPTPEGTPVSTTTPCPMTFTDVHPADYFYEAVRGLYCRGVISGYADNTFRPGNNITRGQMCKLIVLAEGWPIYTPPLPYFCDVQPGHPYYPYIYTAHERGIISGYANCNFRPYAEVTRAQLTKIVVLAEQWQLINPPTPDFSDVPREHTFYQFIETAYSHGIISGYSDGTFRPFNNATRGQISKIVWQAITQP